MVSPKKKITQFLAFLSSLLYVHFKGQNMEGDTSFGSRVKRIRVILDRNASLKEVLQN